MKNYYWSEESWGSNNGEPLPANIEEIIAQANDLINEYMELTGYPADDENVEIFSEKLWERYCSTGTI